MQLSATLILFLLMFETALEILGASSSCDGYGVFPDYTKYTPSIHEVLRPLMIILLSTDGVILITLHANISPLLLGSLNANVHLHVLSLTAKKNKATPTSPQTTK